MSQVSSRPAAETIDEDSPLPRQERLWFLKEPRLILIAGVTIGVVVAVVALASVFASTRSSVAVAEAGTRGVYAEAALSAAATTRNRVVQAVLIASAVDFGVAESGELTIALDDVESGLAELRSRLEELATRLDAPEARATLETATSAMAGDVEHMVGTMAEGGRVEAPSLTELGSSYATLAEILVTDRDQMVRQLELSGREAGRIAEAASFLVALAIPLGLVVTFRRTFRRRQIQHQLTRDLEHQRELSRTKDDFIADLSHELRTPLTSIYGFASTLLDPEMEVSSEQVQEFATLIAMEADELSRMVDDLLTAARADEDALAFNKERVDPATEVEAVLSPMHAMGVEILSKVESAAVAGDRLRLRQVLRNLISNALKHGRPPIAVAGRVEGLQYLLAVTDSGEGVTPELESRLFQRFVHRGRDPLLTGSVGLGLAIARLLVRRMNGNLTYRRADGLTTFIIKLPLWAELEESRTAGQPFTGAETRS